MSFGCGMGDTSIDNVLGSRRLGHKFRQRGDILIPLDEGWDRPRPFNNRGKQLPNVGSDVATVGIDKDRGAHFVQFACMSGEMDFADLPKRKGFKISGRVIAAIVRRDMDVIDVEQQPATRSRNKLR